MPELPEVETVCAGLKKVILGSEISEVITNRKNLRIPFPKNLKSIEGSHVTDIRRRAKYILIDLDCAKTLIVHLGMSGKFAVVKKYEPAKHDHFLIKFKDKQIAVLNDARRFGLVDLSDTKKLDENKNIKHLGAEPLDKEFNLEYLKTEFKKRKVAVKLAIMDQKIVVGVGNIYACEALYMSNINPERACESLKDAEIKALIDAIKKILKVAIKAGGSSIKDYVHADGSLGYFQNQMAVYGKAGETCPRCKKPCIEKITQGGRSTFYCRNTQK